MLSQRSKRRRFRCVLRGWSSRSDRRIAALFCLLGAALFAGGARAQEKETKPVIEDRVLTTDDGWPIGITYYQSPEGKHAPVVVLLHMKGSNRIVWDGFALRLQKYGYAAITVDLRKHGQSKGAADDVDPAAPGRGGDATNLTKVDYRLMVEQDLERVKEFIYEEHQAGRLNMRKMAIVGAEMSGPVAIHYALRDWMKVPWPDAPTFEARTPKGQDVRALVLLSPDANLPGLPSTGAALIKLRDPEWGVAFFFGYGKKDEFDKGTAESMYQKVAGLPQNKSRVNIEAYDNLKLRGTDMLDRNLKLEEFMLAFLDLHVKQLPDPWRNRQSPLVE